MVYVSKGLLTPVMPDPAEKSLGVNLVEFELLELIVGWQHLYLSIFKAVLGLYGLAPSGLPQAFHAGPTSDERLCEEMVSWLASISTDANNFVSCQQLQKAKGSKLYHSTPGSVHDALVNLEQQDLSCLRCAVLIPRRRDCNGPKNALILSGYSPARPAGSLGLLTNFCVKGFSMVFKTSQLKLTDWID